MKLYIFTRDLREHSIHAFSDEQAWEKLKELVGGSTSKWTLDKIY